MNNPITFEARRFALEELAIRAGANSSEWIIEISNYETSVHFDDNRSVGLHFPHLVRKFDGKANRVVRCSWIRPDEASAFLNPNFIVPFCPNEMPDRGPLVIIEGRRARCQVDLTASVLFSMCRIEERLSNARDQHGR